MELSDEEEGRPRYWASFNYGRNDVFSLHSGIWKGFLILHLHGKCNSDGCDLIQPIILNLTSASGVATVTDNSPETIFVFKDLSQSDKAVFTSERQDEGSSPLPRVASPGGSHPCRQRAAGGQGEVVPGSSGGHAEAWPGRAGRAGSREAQHLHASPPPTSHVHRAHGDPRHLQVHQHGGVVPGVRRGYHWKFHSAQDHLQEQVHA